MVRRSSHSDSDAPGAPGPAGYPPVEGRGRAGELASIEAVAESIYGSREGAAFQRWVEYWRASRKRNAELLAQFESLVLIELQGRRILDIGCGTGGLGEILASRGASYFGADYHTHVLQFSVPGEKRAYLRCSGTDLPFPDASFDLVIGFDVIEHLVGGKSWQKTFLHEIRRVLGPMGMVLFTTPNYWYPYDAHSEQYGPQFLPAAMADRYIGWRNPAFLQEHVSFRNIPLLRPGFLRRALEQAGLASLHDLPCGLDRKDYLDLHPGYGWMAYLGLGWLLHAEFWPILVRMEDRPRMRRKLRKNWHYEIAQPSSQPIQQFAPLIDFSKPPFNHQLGPGWFWPESHERGCRWIGAQAVCYLLSRTSVRYLRLEGFSPRANDLDIFVEGVRVGRKPIQAGKNFEALYLIPFPETTRRMLEIEILCRDTFVPDGTTDRRQLGVMIFRLELQS